MPYTAQQLITNAYYLSGVLSRGLETIDAQQLTDGLFRLNGLLAIQTSNPGMIPYYQQYNFNAVLGQEEYFIPGLIIADTLTFNLDNVRYSMWPTTRNNYFATSRVNNINALPFQWHIERTLGGANLYMYFLPQEVYQMVLWGKFGLTDVTIDQDLSLVYDQFYTEYLLYALSEYICEFYNVEFTMPQKQRLKQYEDIIRDRSPIDFTSTKLSVFQPGAPLNYGDANLGHGWRPA